MMKKKFGKPFTKIRQLIQPLMKQKKIINSLQFESSYGYDEVSIKILKISTPFIISTLNYICNKVLSTGIFPLCLKYLVIKPLYKKVIIRCGQLQANFVATLILEGVGEGNSQQASDSLQK